MTEQEINIEEYFNSLNPSKILIGVLSQINKIEIPVSFFTQVSDSQLEVTLNESGDSFVFSLKDNNEQ